MRRAWFKAGALACVLAFAGCGGEDNPSGPSNGNNNPGMTAKIDGVDWASVVAFATRPSGPGGVISVGGSNAAPTTGIGFAFFEAGIGDYPIGPTSATNGNVSEGTTSWQASSSQGSGTITVTELSDTHVAGTFFFEAPIFPPGTAPPPRTVTEGMFNVEFLGTP